MLSIYHYISSFILYGGSILLSFLLTGFLVPPLSTRDIDEDAEENRQYIKRLEEENFQYKFLEEYMNLEENDIDIDLKDKTITLEIPFLKVTIIMFYEDNTFKYYSNTDVIYKYLNVACRKFVVEFNVKKLYIDGTLEEVTTPSVETNLFVTKSETKKLERKINHFIRVGSIHDYNQKNNIKLIKEIDILEFLKTN